MTIRHRITILVLLMIFAIAGIGGYAIYQSRGGAVRVKAVTEGVVPSALAAADLVSALKDVQQAVMTLASASDDGLLKQAREKLDGSKHNLTVALGEQAKNATTDTQRGLVTQAQESLENYFAAIDETVSLKTAGKNEIAQANLFGNVVQYQAELEQIVQTIRVEKNRVKDKAIEALNGNLTETTTTISIVTLVTVIVLSAIGVLLYRRIVGPIARMQRMMTEIAQSQDFSRRVPLDRMDEIGHSIVAFNGMIEQIALSTAQVRRKTADIQSMLQNMQQGILTVSDGLRVHPEYSAYLETILETDRIAGRNLIELLFDGSDAGADAVAQVDAACRACIGEDLINFEFNEHLLIDEVHKRMPDGRTKILEIGWSPIVGDDAHIVRLMLCIRDVTELRKLAAQAHDQRRQLEIIGEILGVSQEKFHEFFVGAMKFVHDNELIIREHEQSDQNAIAQLFRNMHTIKGNARTYGLRHMTDIVHEVEQTYDAMRGPRPDVMWDRELLLGDLAKVRAALEEYGRINEHSLGRKGPGRRGGAERYLMVDKAHIHDTLHRLETVNTASLHELVAVHESVRQTLRLLGTEPIGDMLAGVVESLPSLAQELGKAAPVVAIDDHGLRLRSQLSGMMKNVFMHLLRNAIDHGIELPEVRVLQGKPAAGRIDLEARIADERLVVSLRDDGRGMALKRIRQLAVERGIVAAGAALSDEDAADLVFHPGFSTADKVTGLSGRGVGMDAVKEFVKREQGRIAIEFLDGAAGADYRPFRFVLTLPAEVAVRAAGAQHGALSAEAPQPALVGAHAESA